jgi:hypothetical protein
LINLVLGGMTIRERKKWACVSCWYQQIEMFYTSKATRCNFVAACTCKLNNCTRIMQISENDCMDLKHGRRKKIKLYIMLIVFISTDIAQLWFEWTWRVLLMVAYFMNLCLHVGFIELHQLLDVLFNKIQITIYQLVNSVLHLGYWLPDKCYIICSVLASYLIGLT